MAYEYTNCWGTPSVARDLRGLSWWAGARFRRARPAVLLPFEHPSTTMRQLPAAVPRAGSPHGEEEPEQRDGAAGGMAFERPIEEIEAQIAELENLSLSTKLDISGEIEVLKQRLREQISTTYSELSAWERVNVARHPRTGPWPRTTSRADGRLRRAARRPRLRRRPRPSSPAWRPSVGTPVPAHRAPQGPLDQGAPGVQLRLRTPRGLPQGPAQDEAGREARPADRQPDQHPRRLPGHRRRGARPGHGRDRREHPGHVRPARADLGAGHRRGRLRRRAGHRRRRPRAHDAVRLLLGDQPRGLRRDPLEGRRALPRGRRGAQAHLRAPAASCRSSIDGGPRTPGRGPPRALDRHGRGHGACCSRHLDELKQQLGWRSWWRGGGRNTATSRGSRGASRPSSPRGTTRPGPPPSGPRPTPGPKQVPTPASPIRSPYPLRSTRV